MTEKKESCFDSQKHSLPSIISLYYNFPFCPGIIIFKFKLKIYEFYSMNYHLLFKLRNIFCRFLVYGSRKARSIPMEVPADDINDNAHRAIDPDLPTKVIVHGFGSSCDHVWVYEMRSALMTVHECNIGNDFFFFFLNFLLL